MRINEFFLYKFQIDDEADAAGVKFVKIEDNQLAKEFGVYALPALVFFKKGEDVPVIFAGIFLLLQIKSNQIKSNHH